jgi:voltage-gated potassium channel
MKKNSLFIALTAILCYVGLMFLLVAVEKSNSSSNIKDFFDAFWYSLVTLSTVGYGDRYPVTAAGRMIAIVLLISSFGLLGYIIGTLTNKIKKYMDKKNLGEFGTDFTNHIIVVGWNEFTKNVVGQIVDADKQVAVITDYKPTVDLIHSLFDVKKVFVMFSDYQSPGCFEKLNINEALAVFVNLNQDTDTLVQLLNLKKRYPTTKYIVSLNNNQLKETFTAAGVTYCIAKEEVASKLVASYVFEPNVAALIDDIMSTTTKINDYDIKEYKITSDNPYCGTDCLQVFINLKTKNNCVLLGINKSLDGIRTLIKNPGAESVIEPGDYLVVMMDKLGHRAVDKLFCVKEGI